VDDVEDDRTRDVKKGFEYSDFVPFFVGLELSESTVMRGDEGDCSSGEAAFWVWLPYGLKVDISHSVLHTSHQVSGIALIVLRRP